MHVMTLSSLRVLCTNENVDCCDNSLVMVEMGVLSLGPQVFCDIQASEFCDLLVAGGFASSEYLSRVSSAVGVCYVTRASVLLTSVGMCLGIFAVAKEVHALQSPKIQRIPYIPGSHYTNKLILSKVPPNAQRS